MILFVNRIQIKFEKNQVRRILIVYFESIKRFLPRKTSIENINNTFYFFRFNSIKFNKISFFI